MSEEKEPLIRASEIGQYLYCARSWWLGRVCGYKPSNVAELLGGRTRHAAHGRAVFFYQAIRWSGYVFLAIALVIGLILLWLILKGG